MDDKNILAGWYVGEKFYTLDLSDFSSISKREKISNLLEVVNKILIFKGYTLMKGEEEYHIQDSTLSYQINTWLPKISPELYSEIHRQLKKK